MKKNILAILATFACLAAEAAVTVYTWYGDVGDGLWTTPSNWRKSDYPSVSGADGHCVLFDKGSGTSTTVTLGAGETAVSYIVVKNGTVTINGVDGSYLNPTKGAGIDVNGFVVYDGAKLIVNVDVNCSTRIDKWRQGNIEFRKNVTCITPSNGYSFVLDEGDAIAKSTAELDFSAGTVALGNYNTTDSTYQFATLTLEDSAKMKARTLTTAINSGRKITGKLVQDGSGTEVFVASALNLVDRESNGSFYELNAGTLTYNGSDASFTVGSNSKFKFHGGTLGWPRAFNPTTWGAKFDWSGTVCVTNPAGSNFTWAWPDGNAPTTFVKKGAGGITFQGSTYGVGLEIAAGTSSATNILTIASGTTIVPPSGTYEPWPIELKDPSALQFADYTARIDAPVNLKTPNAHFGQIRFPKNDNKENLIVAHSFTVGTTRMGVGVFEPGYTAAVYGDTGDAVVVPFVWTGASGDGNWGTAGNWTSNGTMAATAPPAGVPVDISTADSITLDVDATVSYIIAMPTNSTGKTTLTGSKVLSFRKWVHSNNKTYGNTGCYVPAGKTLELDVPVAGDGVGNDGVSNVIGGGTVTTTGKEITYTWTGGASGNWNDEANWSSVTGVTNAGYPCATNHVVVFNTDAAVSLNTGTTTDISYLKVDAGTVTITGTSGSKLNLYKTGLSVNGGGDATSGFVVSQGAVLDFRVQMSDFNTRFDRWGAGTLCVSNDVSDVALINKPLGGPWYFWGYGTNYFNGGFVLSSTQSTLGIPLAQDYNNDVLAYIDNDARLDVNLLALCTGDSTTQRADSRIFQRGAGSRVSLDTLDATGRGNYNRDRHCYTLEDGTLSATYLRAVGSTSAAGYSANNAHFVQTGGESFFGNVAVTNCAIELSGGTMNFTGADSAFKMNNAKFNISGVDSANCPILGWPRSFNPGDWSGFNWSGAVSVTNATGNLIWNWTGAAKPTTFVKKGAGGLDFSGGSTYNVELEVAAGETAVIPSGSTIAAYDGAPVDYKWPVALNAGSTLEIASATVNIDVPLNLTIADGGKVKFDGASGFIVAHNLVTNGVAAERGVYLAKDYDFIEGPDDAAIVVPYVWTGAYSGGDATQINNWAEPANWEGGNFPPDGVANAVDLRRATEICLNRTTHISYMIAPSNVTFKTYNEANHGGLVFDGVGGGGSVIYTSAGSTVTISDGVTPSTSIPLKIIGGGTIQLKDAGGNTSPWNVEQEFEWTGGGANSNWTTPANWSVGVGYPSATNHIVVFKGDATVAFDKSTTNAYIKVASGTVTIATNSTNNATLTFGKPGGALNASGFTIEEGAKLNFAVPLAEISTRFDRWGKGELKLYGTVLTKSAGAGAANPHWYICAGTTRLGRDFVLDVTSGDAYVMFGNGDYGNVYTYIEENARLNLPLRGSTLHLTTGGNTYAPDAKVYQTGADSVVDADYLYLNGETRSSQPNTLKSGDGHCYTLSNGTLTASYLYNLGNLKAVSDPANGYEGYNPTNLHYVQEGGVSTFGYAWFKNGSAALRGGVMNYTGEKGQFVVINGSFDVAGGATLNLTNTYALNKPGKPWFVLFEDGSLKMNGGTLGWPTNFNPSTGEYSSDYGYMARRIQWSGTNTVKTPAGYGVEWDWSGCTIADGAVFVRDGDGGFVFPGEGDISTFGMGLQVASGKTVTVPAGRAIVSPLETGYEPWKLVLDGDSTLTLEDDSSALNVPLDLTVKEIANPSGGDNLKGKIRFGESSSFAGAAVAHKLTAFGIELPVGVYHAGAYGFIEDVSDQAAVFVPFVWTGPASGGDWSTAGNWTSNGVVATVAPVNGQPVDISSADSITLNSGATVSCIVAMGGKTTTITGSGSITISSEKDGICGLYIANGSSVIFDLDVSRGGSATKMTMLGGGGAMYTEGKTFPPTASGSGNWIEAVCGTISSGTVFTWNGGASGNWNVAGNWLAGLATAGRCPNGAGDIVVFNGTATVSLNTGTATDVAYLKVASGEVTLNETGGSSLRLNTTGYGVNGGSVGNSGLVIYKGAKLNLNAPIAGDGERFDKWGANAATVSGTLTVNSSVDFTGNGTWYFAQGTNTFDSGARVSQSGNLVIGLTNPDEKIWTFVEGGAIVSAAGLSLSGGSGDAPDVEVEQRGGTVNLEALLELAGSSQSASHSGGHKYTLTDGTLTASNIVVGGSSRAFETRTHFVQTGGESAFTNLRIGANAAGAEILPGNAVLSGGVMSVGAMDIRDGSMLVLSGGRLDWTADDNFDPSLGNYRNIVWTNNPCVSVRAGKEFEWKWSNVNVATNTVFRHDGDGALAFKSVASSYGVGLEVSAGKTATVFEAATVVNPFGSYEPWKVTLRNGAVLKLAEATSRLSLPLDLTVEGAGKIQMHSSAGGMEGGFRGTVIAHKLKVDGAEKAKGRYTGSVSYLDAGTADLVYSAASIIVPYVWIGEGANDNWNTAANWKGGSVPPSGASVDISRAERITLDSDVTVDCVVAMPNHGGRKTVVSGSGRIITSAGSYQCGVYVAEGCELVLDVDFRRSTSATVKPALVSGGGKLTLKKTVPAGNEGGTEPLLAVDGTLGIAGPVVFEPAAGTHDWLMQWSAGPGLHAEVLIENGAYFSSERLYECADGFTGAVTVRQTGGRAVYSGFWMQNHSNATAAEDLKYVLEGGEMSVSGSINLGRTYSASLSRYPGGSFEMTGGLLTAAGIVGGENQNYVRLSGGDVYLTGDCGASLDAPATTNRNEFTFYLGGAKIHGSGDVRVISSGNIWLTGENGDVEFVMDDYNMGIASTSGNIAGPGGFTVSGPAGRTFTAKGTYSNAGTIRVTGGATLAFNPATIAGPTALVVDDTGSAVEMYYNKCTVTKDFESITLADDNCLRLYGQVLTVKRLTVNGVDKDSGEYTVYERGGHGGKVIVGAAAANWLVQHGETWVGNLDKPWIKAHPGDQNISGAKTISAITNSTAGAVTVTGDQITFVDGATIHVGKGDTLTIANTVKIAGTLTKTGAGEVVFNGNVGSNSTPAANAERWILVREGKATFGDGSASMTLEGVAVASCGTDCTPVVTLKSGCTVSNYGIVLTAYGKSGEKCYGETRQEGASIDYRDGCFASLFNSEIGIPLSEPNGGAGLYVLESGSITATNNITFFKTYGIMGGFDFVQNGGLFDIGRSTILMARAYNAARYSYTINGGELRLEGDDTFRSSMRSASVVNLNGGVVNFVYRSNRGAPVKLAQDAFVTVNAGGGVATLCATGTPNTILLDNNIYGRGTLALLGAEIVKEEGDEGAAGTGGKFLVTGGMNMRILRLAGGEVDFAEGAKASAGGRTAIEFPLDGAEARLDYEGRMPFTALLYEGRIRRKGVYSAESVPGDDVEGVRVQIAGGGELLIKGGPGLIQTVR